LRSPLPAGEGDRRDGGEGKERTEFQGEKGSRREKKKDRYEEIQGALAIRKLGVQIEFDCESREVFYRGKKNMKRKRIQAGGNSQNRTMEL